MPYNTASTPLEQLERNEGGGGNVRNYGNSLNDLFLVRQVHNCWSKVKSENMFQKYFHFHR